MGNGRVRRKVVKHHFIVRINSYLIVLRAYDIKYIFPTNKRLKHKHDNFKPLLVGIISLLQSLRLRHTVADDMEIEKIMAKLSHHRCIHFVCRNGDGHHGEISLGSKLEVRRKKRLEREVAAVGLLILQENQSNFKGPLSLSPFGDCQNISTMAVRRLSRGN